MKTRGSVVLYFSPSICMQENEKKKNELKMNYYYDTYRGTMGIIL